MTLAVDIATLMLRRLNLRRAQAFRAAIGDLVGSEQRTAARLIRRAAHSAYGKEHGLSEFDTLDKMRRKLPVSDYAAMQPWLERQIAGEAAISADPALRVEHSRGSHGPVRRVPLNQAQIALLTDTFRIWSHDLIATGMRFEAGRLLALPPPPDAHGVRHTLLDDLPPSLSRLMRPFQILPPWAKTITDPEQWFDLVAVCMAQEFELEAVSTWSPQLLLDILDHLLGARERLLPALFDGKLKLGERTYSFPPLWRRRLFRLEEDPADWNGFWPSLRFLSFWADGPSRMGAQRIAAHFPHVMLQPKGLITAESPITVPLVGAPSGLPLIDRLLIEIEVAPGDIRLLSELQDGDGGRLVISTPGGLMRYRMSECVAVDGHAKSTPCLTYTGQAD